MSARRVAAIVATALLSIMSVPASAWNDAGHLLVALVAYERLSSDARQAALELLSLHPRYGSDLAQRMPSAVRAGAAAERDRWLFAAAATWPDFVRDFQGVEPEARRAPLIDRYHHPRWHYINQPLYLDASEQAKLEPVKTNDALVLGRGPAREMNLVQALLRLRDEVGGSGAAAERAVAFCRLMHLVADLHQPLHTVALYTSTAFPEGDRGGNLIELGRRETLHSLWDAAANRDRRWGAVNKAYVTLPAMAMGEEPVGDFAAWAREGRDLADRVVYVASIREAVRGAQSAPQTAVAAALPAGYLARMREIARRQVALSGLRLARVLEAAFSRD